MDNRVKDFFLFKESTSGLYYLCLRFVRFPFLIISRSDPRWHCFPQIQSRLERNESAKQNCRIVAFIRLCCLKHWLMIWLRSYKCSHHSSPEPIRKPQEWRHNSSEKTKSKTYKHISKHKCALLFSRCVILQINLMKEQWSITIIY